MRPESKLAGALGLVLVATQSSSGDPPGGQILFEPVVTVVGRSPTDAALADFNGDGTLDAAVA